MTRIRVAADLPEDQRPTVEIADTAGNAFRAEVERVRKMRGAALSACDVGVPARVR
jgi:peptidylprolyl isomerase